MRTILLSIRDFALPSPRVGSIEAHSGFGRAAAEGQIIHVQTQSRRKKANESYEAEVRMEAVFERSVYRFQISGRADGLLPGQPPTIEEIKSCFNTDDLKKKLTGSPSQHPYCLQLKTYGYFYWLQHKILPKLSFHLVSTRSFTTQDLSLSLDIEQYEEWLERRLAELVDEATVAEKRITRRKRIAGDFRFPFESPRSGQIELIKAVEDGMAERRKMLIQAPTGLGKTVGILYPALKEALERGQKVIYVTPKNSQHAVAEDAVDRFHDNGAKVKALTITAKGKICFKNEPLCNPEYCEYAKDHYTKVAQNNLSETLAKKRRLSFKTFRELGETHQVCPFELQLEAAQHADVVICDYNYVFAPRTAFGRITGSALVEDGQPNLIIDEAHNLLGRAMDYYSPELSTFALENMRTAVKELPTRFRSDAEDLLNSCIQTVETCRPENSTKSELIDPPAELFLEQDAALRAFLSRYLDSDVEIQPRDVVLRLSFYWSEFTAALEFITEPKRPEFFTTFQPHPKGGTVRITCCDASEMLKEIYDDYDQVVGFSATLKPFDYYATLSGLEYSELKTAEFYSPFPKEHRKLLIIPEISTKYSVRDKNYGKIAEVIQRVSALRSGNYLAFFPSFDFLERTLERFTPPEGFTIVKQHRDMHAKEITAILEHLRSAGAPTIVFGVQGGVFSEGVDYPGEMVIGVFVIGPPLPIFNLEREEMRKYYEEKYENGFNFTYTFPAMSKAVQAAGRVIRSETDKGIIVLMDNRFVERNYFQSMPKDWFDDYPSELVSGSILKEISEFWSENS